MHPAAAAVVAALLALLLLLIVLQLVSLQLQPSGSSSGMLKDLALAREQLKRDLAATQQQLAEAQAAAAAASEAVAAEAGLLRRQLGAAQSALAETEKVRWGAVVWCGAWVARAECRAGAVDEQDAWMAATLPVTRASPCGQCFQQPACQNNLKKSQQGS